MTDSEHLPWNEGLPTAPDVNELQKKWPELKVGDRVAYGEIEALLKIEWRSNRFRCVTDAWRRRELEAGRVIECDPAEAFYVASADQVSAKTYGVLKHIGRKAKRHRTFLSVQRTEDPILAQTITHHGQLMQATERDARKHRMNLLPHTAAPEPPKIPPPKSK